MDSIHVPTSVGKDPKSCHICKGFELFIFISKKGYLLSVSYLDSCMLEILIFIYIFLKISKFGFNFIKKIAKMLFFSLF